MAIMNTYNNCTACHKTFVCFLFTTVYGRTFANRERANVFFSAAQTWTGTSSRTPSPAILQQRRLQCVYVDTQEAFYEPKVDGATGTIHAATFVLSYAVSLI